MRIYLFLIALLGWFALITQFYLNLNSGVASTGEIIIRYFSYFTLLTNLLVAVCCTCLLLAPTSKWGRFFSKTKTSTAVTVYILIVGLIYNTILRFIWNPTGLQMMVDELLHTVIPLMFLFYWIIFANKSGLKWKDIFPWLIYPLVYLIFVLIRGSFSGFYPYPFIHAGNLGMQQTLINALGVTAIFVVVSLIFIRIGRMTNPRAKT